MFHVSVAVGTRVIEFVGIAHADQIDGDAASMVRQFRHNVAPQVGRRRVAVLKDNRVTFTHLDVGHTLAIDVNILFRMFGG